MIQEKQQISTKKKKKNNGVKILWSADYKNIWLNAVWHLDVKINGEVVTELGTKINPSRDKVMYNNQIVKVEKRKVYILLNKPAGYISAAKDQFDNPSILHLVKDIKVRLYPVGRLDKDTTGAIILTNDGDFSYKLTHPKHEVSKTYIAEVEGVPTAEEMRTFAKGVYIDGKKT